MIATVCLLAIVQTLGNDGPSNESIEINWYRAHPSMNQDEIISNVIEWKGRRIVVYGRVMYDIQGWKELLHLDADFAALSVTSLDDGLAILGLQTKKPYELTYYYESKGPRGLSERNARQADSKSSRLGQAVSFVYEGDKHEGIVTSFSSNSKVAIRARKLGTKRYDRLFFGQMDTSGEASSLRCVSRSEDIEWLPIAWDSVFDLPGAFGALVLAHSSTYHQTFGAFKGFLTTIEPEDVGGPATKLRTWLDEHSILRNSIIESDENVTMVGVKPFVDASGAAEQLFSIAVVSGKAFRVIQLRNIAGIAREGKSYAVFSS